MSAERGQQNWPCRAEEAAEGASFLRRWGKRWDREWRDSQSHPTVTGDGECILSRNRPDRPGVQVTRSSGRGWAARRKAHSEMEAVSASPTQPAPGAPTSSSLCSKQSSCYLPGGRWEDSSPEKRTSPREKAYAAAETGASQRHRQVYRVWSLWREAWQAPRPVPTLREAPLNHPCAAQSPQNGGKSTVNEQTQTLPHVQILGSMLRKYYLKPLPLCCRSKNK